ncbi:unnamed protein product [Ascophyllum nodosum]
MPENVLLQYFFECVDFLPFTSRSNILQTMTIMVYNKNPAPPDRALGEKEGFGFDIARTTNRSKCAMQDGEEGCGGEDGLCPGPSTCMFWCALAIGGLAKGQNMELVSSYVSRAEAAVEGIAGTVTVELARARTILAYTYALAGNIERFDYYLQGADTCLQAGEGFPNDVQVVRLPVYTI